MHLAGVNYLDDLLNEMTREAEEEEEEEELPPPQQVAAPAATQAPSTRRELTRPGMQ